MTLPRQLAFFNRTVTNRLVAPLAGRSRHIVVLEHQGRRSGRAYATPLKVFWQSETRGVIALSYGTRTDWLHNVRSGPATIVDRGVRKPVAGSDVIAVADCSLPWLVRRVLHLMRVQQMALVTVKVV